MRLLVPLFGAPFDSPRLSAACRAALGAAAVRAEAEVIAVAAGGAAAVAQLLAARSLGATQLHFLPASAELANSHLLSELAALARRLQIAAIYVGYATDAVARCLAEQLVGYLHQCAPMPMPIPKSMPIPAAGSAQLISDSTAPVQRTTGDQVPAIMSVPAAPVAMNLDALLSAPRFNPNYGPVTITVYSPGVGARPAVVTEHCASATDLVAALGRRGIGFSGIGCSVDVYRGNGYRGNG